MADSEFYQGPEHWPQPPDEHPTLSPAGSAALPLKRRVRKSNSKARKKLSESFSGAAVTVVAAAVLIGALPEVPELAEIVEPPVTEVVEVLPICPVCQRESCPYDMYMYQYSGGTYQGIRVAAGGEVAFSDVSDLYAMPGFSTEDSLYVTNVGCVTMDSGQRLVLDISSELGQYLPGDYWTSSTTNSYYLPSEGSQAQHTGAFLFSLDSEHSDRFIMAALVCSPTPEIPQVLYTQYPYAYLQTEPSAPDVSLFTHTIEDAPNTQLQFATNVDGLDLETLLELVRVTRIEEPFCTYPLGSTMSLTENQSVLRSYQEFSHPSIAWVFPIGENSDNMLQLEFYQKYYAFFQSNAAIAFAGESWTGIFQTLLTLNEEAPLYGHEAAFLLPQLGEWSCNGITYDLFAVISAFPLPESDVQYTGDLYYVPRQESCIAVRYNLLLSQEELQALCESGALPYHVLSAEQFLSQITLR